MQTLCFTVFFMLSYAPSSPLSCASTVTLSRRYLYDDFSALPPPLSPTSPPFFPLDSSLPPPPPPPTFAVFPTFPANISALVLPRSPKPHSTSPTLLVTALSAVLAVATAIGFALFLYGRWQGQNRHFKDSNTSSHDEEEQRHITTTTNNFSVAATTSPSEVFFLSPEESDRVRTGGISFVKPESPEIRPLPPLPSRSFKPNYEAEEPDEEEEDDEFFSPLASLAGSENSSPSRSGFEPDGPYSTSCSSGWVSPERSFSIPMSPPQSSNPRFSDVSSDQKLQSLPHHSNPRYSNACWDQKLESPSPDRLQIRKSYGNGSSSLRMFSFWNQNLGFPRISSTSTSPERGYTIRTPLSSLYSSVSTSPDGFFRKFLDGSPPIWNDFSRNVKSVLLSSDSASSRRDFVINIAESSSGIAPPPTRPPPLVPPSQSFVVPELPPKQLYWDKLRQSSCQKTAWDCLRSSSFKLDKEMVETLFIANSSNPNIKQRGLSYDLPIQHQEIKVLDPRKAQNIASLLQLLNLNTKDVCQALLDGDYAALGAELLECLSLLAPNREEENKLKSYNNGSEIIKLGPAERFLMELLHVPFVFKRVDALLLVANFHLEIEHLRRSFSIVQAACEELRNSRMFSTLVEAILKTGNKMNVSTNRCSDAHAFKLDTLLELVEIKGLDGRSSLLHFVVQEMIKSGGTVKTLVSSLEGIRNLNSELINVKKSADIEYGVLRSDVLKLYQGIKNIEDLMLLSEKSESSGGDQWLKFRETMARFLETAAEEIMTIKTQEHLTRSALEDVTEQFHGDSFKEGHTLRIFMIVRDFLSILEKVCNEM